MVNLLVSIVACLLACNAFAQSTAKATFSSVELSLPIPPGYCVIPREDPLGAAHYKLQEDRNSGQNKVAVLFANCSEWERRLQDHTFLQQHGSYLLQLTQGQERLLPATLGRAEVIQVYVEHELKNNVNPAERGRDLADRVRARLVASEKNAPTLQGSVNVGMIDKSAHAVFLGLGMSFEHQGELHRVVGVVAATSVRRVLVAINLYGPATGQAPFGDLLVQQKELTKQLVELNP
jgi:hypothetical protein